MWRAFPRAVAGIERGRYVLVWSSGGYRVRMMWLTVLAVWLAVISVRFAAVKVRKWRRRHIVRTDMGPGTGPNVVRGPLLANNRYRFLRMFSRRRCRRCWWRLARERGHMLAWSEGGADENHNFVPLCHVCNQGQGARTPWWQWLRILTPWVGWRFPVPTPLMVGLAVWFLLR